MREWLLTWVTAHPEQAAVIVAAVVSAVISCVSGIAAWRAWHEAQREDWLSEGNVR